jgi:adhesin/invasin
MIGGQQAQVSFSGLAPGFPGLYQINATVPAGLTGNQQVTVSIGGQTSPAVTLPVK